MLRNKSAKRFVIGWIVVSLILIASAMAGKAYAESVPQAAQKYKRDLVRISRSVWGLDAPISVFAAQIHQESAWNPNAVSSVGAEGLTQFMPATSDWISGLYSELSDNEPRNPIWAMRAMVSYDSWLWQRVKAQDECSHMAMALSGFNGGLGWVIKDQAKAKANGINPGIWFANTEKFNAGRSSAAFKENRGYPRNILLKWQPMYASWGGGIVCLV